MGILLFGDEIVETHDIVEIKEKYITFNVEHTKKNPEPQPKGFFAKILYSDTITYYEQETYFCLELKVKGGVQMRGRADESGNVSIKSHQLYEFYTVCNDKKLIQRVREDIESGSTEKVCEIGNYFVSFGILCYPNYLYTNVMVDETIKSRSDFVRKYMV